MKKDDNIENEVGIVLNKKVGNFVENGEEIAYIHANSMDKAKKAVEQLVKIYEIE